MASLMRECVACQKSLPLEQFDSTTKLGIAYKRRQCHDCCNQRRRRNRVYGTVARYDCRVCGSARVWAKGGRCRPCANAERSAPTYERTTYMPPRLPSVPSLAAAKHDADQMRARSAERRTAEPEKYMEVAYGEIWQLTAECKGRCGKLILIPGRCYECAVGRPRTILRGEERERITSVNVA